MTAPAASTHAGGGGGLGRLRRCRAGWRSLMSYQPTAMMLAFSDTRVPTRTTGMGMKKFF
ncbi:MAG: hypothetical protein ACP5OU_02560 [Methanothrix sp.]